MKLNKNKFNLLGYSIWNLKFIPLITFSLVGSIFLTNTLFICPFIYAAEPKKAPEKTEAPQKFNVGDFVYTLENRRDPFEPLYLLKIKRDITAGVSKKGYELEELKLVGILKADKSRYAMMEDMQGKGVTFKKGDFLNNNLWVLDILDDKVILGYKIKGETKRIEVAIPKKT